MTIKEWLDEKYSGGGPGSDRFKNDSSEIHSSKVSNCQRKYYFDFHIDRETEPSPYFELGRMFERAYGRALAWKYGDPDELRRLEHHEVTDAVDRIQQDVQIEVHIENGLRIVGECDWVVLAPDAPIIESVVVKDDGSRLASTGNRVVEYDPEWVETVIETKTIKNTKWVRLEGKDAHYYQLGCYLHALDSDGELVYMSRNDFDYVIHEVPYDEDFWMDIELRARQHHANVQGDDVPKATPMNEWECRYCKYQSECKREGGSEHV